MIYTINHSLNTFFTSEECDYVLQYMEKKGTPHSYRNNYDSWDCKRIDDDDFKNWFIEKFNSLHKFNNLDFWFNYSNFDLKNLAISLTKYYDGRYLDLHLDKTSKFTTIIPLTDDYEDGRFVLSNNLDKKLEDCDLKINISKGKGITFEGVKTYHGVMPVYKGIRCSMNIWMTDMDYNYPTIKIKKTLL